MTAAQPTPLVSRIAQEHAASADVLPVSVVSRERRRIAMEALATRGLPTTRDENWKYANLRPLDKVRFAPAAPNMPAAATVTAESLPAPIQGYARYTFVDGVFVPALSTPDQRRGVTVRSLRSDSSVAVAHTASAGTSAAASKPAGLAASTAPAAASVDSVPADNRFALLNDAFATDGLAIRVSAGVDCPTCLELLFVASADASVGASYPRVELQVEAGAQLGLIERHVSVGNESSFINSSVSIDVARGASVRHYRLQHTGTRSIWIDTLSAQLAQDAAYKLFGVGLGALSARSTVHVQLLGERAAVDLSIASVADRNQTQDAFALVEHIAPHARTEQTFRGISAGRARVACNGKIVVRKEAHGTDSRQSLRGLLAGPEAEIDVRPQLEIYTDDVRCSHGATAGKLDQNMLFYLLSRGLDRETAQRLLKWAFLEDVVARIEVPDLRRQIEQSLAGQMQDATGLNEGTPHVGHGEVREPLPQADGKRAAPAQNEVL